MRKIHRLDLDFAKDIRTQRKITFKEQDSITLYISIYNDGVPVMLEGQIPRLFVKKSDGTVLYQREVLQVQNNVVAFDVHRQATTCPGLCYAEVEFIEPKGDGKDELITTRNFVYLVEPKVGDIENAIVSQDEAYFLKTVEDFINQSKKDLAEYKATALEIENQIDEANNRMEQLNKDLEEADLSLSEAKEQALEEINAVKDENIANIETTASNGLQEIETAKTDTINEINTLKENSIELFNVKYEEIIASGTQIKNDIEDLGNTVTTEITEGLESLEDKKTEVVTKVDEKIDEAETKLNEIKIAQEEIDETIRLSNITKNDLETLRQSAIDIIEELNNSSIEAEAISNLLNNLIADCNAMRNALEIENNKAISNLEELNPLNIEADLNIEELRALIQEARDIAIPALKAYIAEHQPAEDLTEVNQQLEELYNAVRELDIRFNNYYTKNEVDEKINTYKGEIGYSEYKIKPEGFDEAFEKLLKNPQAIYPSMKGNVVGYIMGTISRQTNTNASGTRIPGVILFTDNGNFYNALKPTIINSATTNREFDIVQLKTMSGGTVSSSNRNSMSYPCIIDSATGEFISGYIPNSNYHYTITDYYYSTVDIYNNDGTIAYDKCEGEIEAKISDFNEAVESGNYKVNIKEGEVVANTPLEGAIQGILDVNKAKDVIHQELSTNKDEVFSRIYLNGNWTEWKTTGASDIDLSNFYNKTETDNKIDEKISEIELPEIDMGNIYTKEEIDEKFKVGKISESAIDDNFDPLPENTFKDYPANPDINVYLWEMKCTHFGYHMVFYFKENPQGKFGIVKRTDGKLGFKLLDSSFKYSTYKSWYRNQNSTSGSWTAFSNDNHFNNPTNREINAMYYHNFKIVNADNPSEILRHEYGYGLDKTISDFNKAIDYNSYSVSIEEEDNIANSPVSGTFKGVLEVVKANGFIEQTLKDINSDTSYFRRFDKTSWSEWRPNTIIEYGEHIIEAVATIPEYDDIETCAIARGTIKDNDKYYARIAPTKRFTKVTGVTLSSDLADLIIGFELNLNAVLINNSKDFMLFLKNNFKTNDDGYKAYEGLNMLMGRKIKYTIIGY